MDKQLLGDLIVSGNMDVLEALKMVGVPLAKRQAFVLSKKWIETHRKIVVERFEKPKKKGQTK